MKLHHFTARIVALTLVLGFLNASHLLAQDGTEDSTGAETTQPEPRQDSQASENSNAPENASADPNAAQEELELPFELEEESWMKSVDKFFGKYLVGPLASVFFYDFGSGPVYQKDTGGNVIKDRNGDAMVKRQGWLRTGGAPNGTSVPFVVVWLLLGGLFLTVRMGFINLRAFWHAIRLTRGDYDDPDEEGEVSHFQALSAALSATVGLGNIGGVAIAIGLGGPGAAFWIFAIGLIGMSTKFAECTLGQLYRTTDEKGNTLGGPMRYLKEGLAEKGLRPLGIGLSVLFALLCIGASFGGGNAYQVGQSLSAIQGEVSFLADDRFPWLYGIVMAIGVGVVIIGGIKSIGAVAGKIVPLMCAAYVGAALWILLTHFSQVPDAVASILSMAFSGGAAYGGLVGILVIGVQRAVFSNEAGVGSAAIAHSAAKTNEPVSEGIVALLEPFIDTVVVCTITALVIVVTGAYDADRYAEVHAENPAKLVASVEGTAPETIDDETIEGTKAKLKELIEGKKGAAMTLVAFRSGGFHWFGYILFVAVVLFAFSTCISWSYYGERCWVQLFGVKTSMVYKVLFLLFTFLGSIVTAGKVLDFSDLMILGMSLPNLLGVFILSGVVKGALDKYWMKYKSGQLEKMV